MSAPKICVNPPFRAHAYLQLIYEDGNGVQLVILTLLVHVCSIVVGREAGKERMARWQALDGMCGR